MFKHLHIFSYFKLTFTSTLLITQLGGSDIVDPTFTREVFPVEVDSGLHRTEVDILVSFQTDTVRVFFKSKRNLFNLKLKEGY